MTIFLRALLLIFLLGNQACKEALHSGSGGEALDQQRREKTIIEFQIDEPEWKEPSPYVSLENPDPDIRNMRNPDEIVLGETELTLILDYPLNGEWKFPISAKSPSGFTRAGLAKQISDTYKAVYAEEARTSDLEIVPLEERKGVINRNRTNGKYGIWGHDLGDLVLHRVEVTKGIEGSLSAILGIDS